MAKSISVPGAGYRRRGALKYAVALREEFIYGGHLTALGAPMMVLFTSILTGLPVSLPLLFIAYLAALVVYSNDYYGSPEREKGINPERASYLSARSAIYPYAIVAYAVLLLAALALFATRGLVLLIAALVAGGILYSACFKGITKNVPGFKNAYTSAIWAAGCAFGLPLYYSAPFDATIGLVFLFMFIRGLSNNIFFDLKDVGPDAAAGLRTLPVALGEKRTVALLRALNLAAVPVLAIGVCLQWMPVYVLSMVALEFSTFWYLGAWEGGGKRGEYTYYLLADAEVLFWPLLLELGKIAYFAWL